MAIGTISSDTEMLVKWMNGTRLGTVEESFIGRLKPGDDFGFAGRVLRLVQVKDMTAYVRASTARRTQVPRWQGGRLPLSVELADAVLELLGRPVEWPQHPRCARPRRCSRCRRAGPRCLRRTCCSWSAFAVGRGITCSCIPSAGAWRTRASRRSLRARWARVQPQTFSVNANDYGFELLSPTEIDAR